MASWRATGKIVRWSIGKFFRDIRGKLFLKMFCLVRKQAKPRNIHDFSANE